MENTGLWPLLTHLRFEDEKQIAGELRKKENGGGVAIEKLLSLSAEA